ncbi:MAG: hypothetical protein QME66_11370 [Candidatus Eisenbacteria bacterium]|nr:hypothetical protein [Candidatus Eisenbacteria bacterium]
MGLHRHLGNPVFLLLLVPIALFSPLPSFSGVNGNAKILLHAEPHVDGVQCIPQVSLSCPSISVSNLLNGQAYDVFVILADATEIRQIRFGVRYPMYRGGASGISVGSWGRCFGTFEDASLQIVAGAWPDSGTGITLQATAGQNVSGQLPVLGRFLVTSHGTDAETLRISIDPRLAVKDVIIKDSSSRPDSLCTGPEDSSYGYPCSQSSLGLIIFGSGSGYNPCGVTPALAPSWGRIKALYR